MQISKPCQHPSITSNTSPGFTTFCGEMAQQMSTFTVLSPKVDGVYWMNAVIINYSIVVTKYGKDWS
jgi:hypothetical protein